MFKKIVLLSYGLIFILGCNTKSVVSNASIQKRKYRKGFYVNHADKLRADNEQTQKDKKPKASETTSSDEDLIIKHSPNEEVIFAQTDETSEIQFATKQLGAWHTYKKKIDFQDEQACDIIFLKNGEEIEAIIMEVGTEDVRYKLCQNPDGPIFVKYRYEIFKINFKNGTSTIISSIENKPTYTQSPPYNPDDKDYDTAIILCLLLLIGFGGIHRMYMGYVGIGIIQLLTGGCCGIWQLIDLIRILNGTLKPKNGEFIKK